MSLIIVTEMVKLSPQYPLAAYFIVKEISMIEIFMMKIKMIYPKYRHVLQDSGYWDGSRSLCEFLGQDLKRKGASLPIFLYLPLTSGWKKLQRQELELPSVTLRRKLRSGMTEQQDGAA